MKLTKNELKEIYSKNDIIEAAKKVGVSVPTLYKYLDECKIPRKGRGRGHGRKLDII